MKDDTIIRSLEKLFDKGFMQPVDVEFCRFLAETEPSVSRPVLLAACLTSMAYQGGHVCLMLEDYASREVIPEAPDHLKMKAPALETWLENMHESSLVGEPGNFRPLILDDSGRLYLHRLWKHEQALVQAILQKVHEESLPVDTDLLQDGLERLFEDHASKTAWQKVAAVTAVEKLFSVISGGPGTGKTSTVIRILALLLEQGRQRSQLPDVALAAPTGKAAARLEEAIRQAKPSLPADDDIKEALPAEVSTIHQLLGARRHSAQFQFNEEHPLPYDCLVIDEASMVDQRLMSRIMAALKPQARLILLGDKDQLASVEAGSVLGDICGHSNENRFSQDCQSFLHTLNLELPNRCIAKMSQPLIDHLTILQKSYRFDSEGGIGLLAKAINQGRADEAWSILNNQNYSSASVEESLDYASFEASILNLLVRQFKETQASDQPLKKLEIYQGFKVLSAHRRGPWGVETINEQVDQLLRQRGLISPRKTWYDGRPVIINANDYELNLSNGDLGVCVRDENGELRVCFDTDDGVRLLSPSRMPSHSTAFALTVHKSQGSEFEDVTLVLPSQASRLLSRELLYTAITRARGNVKIMGTEKIFTQAVGETSTRNSGLNNYLWK